MNDKLQQFADKLKDAKSCYGAGGMQNRKRPNGWRKTMAKFLKDFNINLVNPVEDNKDIFSNSMMGFKEEGVAYTLDELRKTDPKKRCMMFKQTEENDLHYMEVVDFQLFYLDKSAGFGTYTEFRENYDKIKKPVVIIRTLAVEELPHWIEWRWLDMLETGDAIEFKSFAEAKKFFKNYMNISKQKEIECPVKKLTQKIQ